MQGQQNTKKKIKTVTVTYIRVANIHNIGVLAETVLVTQFLASPKQELALYTHKYKKLP
jgi:hypothetical protein